MSEKPKRPWFRFHLLTAVLIMVASGVFIGCNCWRRSDFVGSPIGEGYGWPLLFYFDTTVHEHHWIFSGKDLCANILVAMVPMFLAALICEWLIRRHEGRKS